MGDSSPTLLLRARSLSSPAADDPGVLSTLRKTLSPMDSSMVEGGGVLLATAPIQSEPDDPLSTHTGDA